MCQRRRHMAATGGILRGKSDGRFYGSDGASLYGKQVPGIERSTFLIVVREWRGVKVPGHVDEVLASVRALGADATPG